MSWRQALVPLVRCRDCESPLLQPIDVAGPIDGASIVTRHCPDCECRDIVVADEMAVQAWLARNDRIARWMAASADELADELARAEATAKP